jgi:thiosulfate/3-mercaptopyruvate sulfurtransferase
MRKAITKVIAVSVLALLMMSGASLAGAQQGIVTAEWLQSNLSKVTVVDIRKVEDYKAGHVPGAINVFYGTWAIQRGGLLNELPADDDLRDVLSEAGIEPTTSVVLVGTVATMTDRVGITRVAWTLSYAGVANVSILDGGFEKWVADKKPVSKEPARTKSKRYKGTFNKAILVSKAYVLENLGKATVVDTREAPFYNGEKKLDFVARLGHLKGAVNLPTYQVFNADGTFKPKGELEAMAQKVVGGDKSKEIILYCDSGKFASAWWYLLTHSMGYKDVKVYDGSMQDFAKDPNAPMVK